MEGSKAGELKGGAERVPGAEMPDRQASIWEIPRVIHHVWIGNKPLPELARHYIGTWRRHHPDWEMRLWTDANLPPMVNRTLYDSFTNAGPRSDVLRYEVLARQGGVYADVDVECLRPLDPLLLDPLLPGISAFLGDIKPCHTETGPQGLEIAVLGAAPGHPFFMQVLAHLPAWAGAFRPFTSSLSTGPQFIRQEVALWEHLREHRQRAGTGGEIPRLTRFPPSYFYPLGWADVAKGDGAGAPSRHPGAYALHHWWGTWHDPAVEEAGPVCTVLSERLYPCLRRFVDTLPPDEYAAAEALLLDECRACAASANAFYRLAAARVLTDLPQAEARTLQALLSRDPNAAVATRARPV